MTVANAINKKVIVGVQGEQGTVCAADLATAQTLRFLKFTQGQTNETYISNEMRPDRQVGDVNLGPQSCDGSMNGELSPGTYKTFMAAVLRKEWVAGVSMNEAATANVAAATAGTFTRDDVGGSFITDGFKVGDVVRWTGWDETANNAHNMLITALTATVMTVTTLDGVAVVTEAKGGTVACSVEGKKLWTPASGHTENWLTIEHNYSDVDLSEVYYDSKITSMAIKAPASGIPTVDFNLLGLQVNDLQAAASPYFTAPVAITTTEAVLSGKAIVFFHGTQQVLATGIDIDIKGNNAAMGAVLGTNVKPGIVDKRLEVTGNISVYFKDAIIRDLFKAGTEVAIYAVFPVSSDANADFIALQIPLAKLTGASKDGDAEIIQSVPFQAIFNSDGDDGTTCTTTSLATTLSIQDSAAA